MIRTVGLCLLLALMLNTWGCSLKRANEGRENADISQLKKRPPNIVVIFADDLGYGDISSYGAEGIRTPNIDSIGSEGFISRDFFVPANVCSPSRASLLTGRYPMRNGLPVAIQSLSKKHNNSKFGLHPDELTLPQILKPAGYQSIAIGKWHLGFSQGSHPLDAGFDHYYGIQSNYYKPAASDVKFGLQKDKSTLYKDRDIVEENMALEKLTKLYTDEAISFMEKNTDKPFFMYFAHNISHSPHRPRQSFIGTSDKGKYGDFIHELDYSTGRVLASLKALGLEENTIVVFTSDNGANYSGSNGLLNGGKYTTMEGGHIVPAMFRWPGVIPAGLDSNVTLSSMDLFPLFASIGGVSLPADRIIDGKPILNILRGKSGSSPHKVLYYYNGTNLQAIRKGKWKLHLPRTVADQPFWHEQTNGTRIHTELDEVLLFDLQSDRGETTNLADQYPDIVASFQNEIELARAELGDVNTLGSDQRVLSIKNPQKIDRWWTKKSKGMNREKIGSQ